MLIGAHGMIDKKRLTGIADEGAASIEGQLELHKSLGWDSIELRFVDGVNVCEMDDAAFDKVASAIEEAEFRTVAFGSAIANWSRSAEDPFERDRDDLLRSVPRMHRLGCPYIRIMSYMPGSLQGEEWASAAINRVKELTRIASGEGVVLVLENCDGWAAKKPENFRRLFEEIPEKTLRVVFDPGNPLSHGDAPESVIDFFRAAMDRIVHFHIKDCYPDDEGKAVHCFPGEGRCCNASFIAILEKMGYKGMYSIEPHMTGPFHDTGTAEEAKAAGYLEYGRRAEAMLKSL